MHIHTKMRGTFWARAFEGRSYCWGRDSTMMFCVQVVTIFLATFVAGSFLNQVQLFISAPKSILRILGAAAPQTASFFMSYLLLLGLTTKPILFLRIPRAPLASPLLAGLPTSRLCLINHKPIGHSK